MSLCLSKYSSAVSGLTDYEYSDVEGRHDDGDDESLDTLPGVSPLGLDPRAKMKVVTVLRARTL